MISKIFFGISLSAFLTVLNAGVIEGYLPCGYQDTNDVREVVVFVNGIDNELPDAEESRQVLERLLRNRNICTKENGCIVEKYYNKTQGRFDDIQELNFVGDMERDVANKAFRKLLVYLNIDYLKYKDRLKKNSDFKIENYAARDHKVWEVLRTLRVDAIDSNSDPEIKFSESGSDVIGWLIRYVMQKADLPSPYNSLVTATLQDKKAFYNAKFKSYYSAMIKSIYMSNRKFYGDDNDADVAITKSVEGLVTYLEELLLSGKKIVVVAHSQGNHIIELAYSILRDKWGLEAVQAIQVVGVAVVASTTPNDTYLTWDKDKIATGGNDAISDGDQLKSNFTSKKIYMWWTNNHSFTKVYMNPELKGRYFPQNYGNLSGVQAYLNAIENDPKQEYPVTTWIAGLIQGSLDVAQPYVNEIDSSGIITATLRWEQYDDMDLWTDENSQNMVSYNDQTGIFNSALDRDDTDGEGPEHYTADLTCEQLQNKTWGFGIHQYPDGGSSAVAHFSIKIGNMNPYQKTYSLSSWPSDILWISKIEFGQMTDNNRIPYSLIVTDF